MKTTTVPRATVHQEAIVRALVKLFELSIEDLHALQRGGARAIEKLVRSYHYWATEYERGICPYDHPRLGYFRMTPKAAHHDGSTKDLHCEHVVPVRWIVDSLMKAREQGQLNEEAVRSLMALNEIVVVTKEQAKQIDAKFRHKMPLPFTPGVHSHLVRLENALAKDQLRLVGDRLVGPAQN